MHSFMLFLMVIMIIHVQHPLFPGAPQRQSAQPNSVTLAFAEHAPDATRKMSKMEISKKYKDSVLPVWTEF